MNANAKSAGDPEPPTSARDEPLARPETMVPPDEEPAGRCPYCRRPFPTQRLRALHVGDVHAELCTDEEREAYEGARKDETDELFLFHFKIVGGLGLMYALFVLAYMIVLG